LIVAADGACVADGRGAEIATDATIGGEVEGVIASGGEITMLGVGAGVTAVAESAIGGSTGLVEATLTITTTIVRSTADAAAP